MTMPPPPLPPGHVPQPRGPGAPPPQPVPEELLSTRCPGCGSQLGFAAGTSSLRCVTCGYVAEIGRTPDAAVDEHDYAEWAATNAGRTVASLGGHVMKCDGCGSTTESTALSTSCQFCGGHLVGITPTEGVVAPEAVVPFALDNAAARAAFTRWVTSRFFGPNSLKDVDAEESLRGTYLPYWTFDAHTTSDYEGQRGDDYTVRIDDDHTETRTRWSHRSGRVERFFDDIVVDGSEQLTTRESRGAGRADLDKAEPYRPEYVAGFSTVRYDVDPPQALETAKRVMARTIRSDVERDIGGDRQRVAEIRTAYAAVMFKLVLMPFWIATYMYAGKQWQVVINASTGKVTGKHPVSVIKVVLTIVASLVALALAFFLYMKTRS
ncbi:hypothetical protein ACTVCO_08895 [Sanguibacter sp. A247]|uniref:hypothetical protein n=1 Tax=unclassified Sanguibacter TaxID=2645534 RepID=UPI003FD823E0